MSKVIHPLEPTIEEFSLRLSAHSDKPLVNIYQNVYSDSVKPDLDPDFIAVDGRQNANTDFRENGLFMRMYSSGLYKSAKYTGIVSPKFGKKTLKSGKDFKDFVERNPGYDVYFIDPFVQNSYYTYNVWDHAEMCHPGLVALAELLFSEAGYDISFLYEPRHSRDSALYSNFWVGNETFWNSYMSFVMSIIDALDRLPLLTKALFFEHDPVYPDPVPVLPFILERCPSTFFSMNPDIRRKAFPFTREEIIYRIPRNSGEEIIVTSFIDWVDDIDMRKEYSSATREIFRGMTRARTNMARLGL